MTLYKYYGTQTHTYRIHSDSRLVDVVEHATGQLGTVTELPREAKQISEYADLKVDFPREWNNDGKEYCDGHNVRDSDGRMRLVLRKDCRCGEKA